MPKSKKPQIDFRNEHKASFLSREISLFFNRGSSTANHIETVLNIIRETSDAKSLKQLDTEKIQKYVKALYSKLQSGKLSSATTSTYISALNDIINYANSYANKSLEPISAKDFNLNRGEFKFHDNIVNQKTHNQFLDFLKEQTDIRAKALMHSVTLQRELGLRLRESVGITKETIKQALKTGVLHLDKSDGTKNGQARGILMT